MKQTEETLKTTLHRIYSLTNSVIPDYIAPEGKSGLESLGSRMVHVYNE